MTGLLLYLVALGGGYVLGSIPFGFISAWMAGAGDVRKIGSGATGATNVLRTGNRWAAAATLIGDVGKGLAAVILARSFYGSDAGLAAGLGAFLGHLFPVWLGFRGGKGGATSLGILFAVNWFAGIGIAVTWLGVLAIWRISSLATLLAASMAPLYLLMLRDWRSAVFATVIAIGIAFMHRDNIRRLRAGTEPRVGGS